MGRSPYCSMNGLNKGAWTVEEDKTLTDYVKIHGEGKWSNVAKKTGLKRCGKSCRLRWMNYLRPGIKRGNISIDEEELIVRLHKLLGNRWSLIAGRLPGRTDNEIKNYWNTNLAKKAQDCFRLTLPTTRKSLHQEVPTPPPPDRTTKSDTKVISVPLQQENDELHGRDRTFNLGPTELNHNVLQSVRIKGDTTVQPCGNVDASPSSVSGDEYHCPPDDQFMDTEFNMEDFCKILDSEFEGNSVPVLEEELHEDGGNINGDVTPKESWSGKIDESAQVGEAEGTEFMSLISFLDSVPPAWQEII